ncbi:MAG: SusD/RagB family nutrient-binding outer membrane lipoprotein [Bacteroidota bacterium]
MKIKFNKALLVLCTLSAILSCEGFLEGTNENPNDPTNVAPSALLTPVEITLGFQYGGNFSRYSGVFVQHVKGLERQWAGFDNYVFRAADFDDDWSLAYVDILSNIDIIIDIATTNGYNHYNGVAKTLKAYTLLLMTDFWNDMPYSDGLVGIEVLQPEFDEQATIYNEVHLLLEQARQDLAQGDGGLSVTGDLIFAGNAASWTKAAHAIDARAYLHQALLDDDNYTSALASIDAAFTSIEDNMGVQFGSTATTAAPWFQFNRDRGDIGFNSTMNDLMISLNDPRLDLYDGDGLEDEDGNPLTFLDVDHGVFKIDRNVPLLTYTELMFAKAECLLQTGGNPQEIRESYLEGVRSSFEYYGLGDLYANFAAQEEVNPLGDVTLEHVMTQKYLALFSDPEVFTDWRRTNIPDLIPNDSNAIPTRWLYPQTEINTNPNVPSVTMTDKVDWDSN